MDKMVKLERQWYHYKIKILGKYSLISFLFFLVIIGGYFIGLNMDKLENTLFNEEEKEVKKEQNITIEPVKIIEKPITLPLTTESVMMEEKSEKEELSLEPVIPIIDIEKEKSKSLKPYRSHVKKSHPPRVRAKPNSYLTVKELSTVQHQLRDTTRLKKMNLHSSRTNYTEMIEKKFLKSKRPREALLLAKEFYRKGEYAKAESWALTANKMDTNLDESWIIFAQAKAKMNKKNEAINILLAYYEKSKSAKIKRAIEKIKRER